MESSKPLVGRSMGEGGKLLKWGLVGYLEEIRRL